MDKADEKRLDSLCEQLRFSHDGFEAEPPAKLPAACNSSSEAAVEHNMLDSLPTYPVSAQIDLSFEEAAAQQANPAACPTHPSAPLGNEPENSPVGMKDALIDPGSVLRPTARRSARLNGTAAQQISTNYPAQQFALHPEPEKPAQHVARAWPRAIATGQAASPSKRKRKRRSAADDQSANGAESDAVPG
ncbi:hydrolase isoform B [Chlorella sorokiniana]|uniref:Hydrolase isoform A n=1 Tax=Chlorella sorokiniana TaxID=3076 RepID=A0A2P6TF96_CHLSO|nr:hydrolase isoform A [Chlorella sorokiniana]PRW32647.1 hydrolase isoform B [Chlorella sorokiniana]|eukprot:PRW32646.1 hydrolase isoform A [Chlorella sorokiniana]